LVAPRRFFDSMRRSCEPLVGRVFLRTFGSIRAVRISAASRSAAARRFCSWLRSLRALNKMLPSSMSFCPAMARSRFLAATGRLEFRGSRNRSCAALDTLLTFWPPGRGRGVHDDFALRHRNGDAVFLEKPPYRPIHLGTDVVDAFLRIGDPEAQLEFDAAVAEVHQARHRRGIAQDPRLAFAGIEQYLERQFRIVAVADANRQLQADARIGVAPIDHGV
jgi:hypothetical protein